MQYEGETFTEETITLDGNEFTGCHFRGCTLRFGGGATKLSSVSFDGTCSWDFFGSASATFALLANLNTHFGAYGQSIVDGVFSSIKSPASAGIDPN